jgi:TonB-linked SusC/RagA family outer membrane protein
MKRIILLAGFLISSLLFCNNVNAQTSIIAKGHVTDKITTEALPFVNVVEIDKNGRFISGTVTDMNGNFVLKIRDTKNLIQVSFIGYKKYSSTIDNKTQFDVVLESESQSLEEIKIEGNKVSNDGYTKVRDRATAITTMEFKDMKAVMSTTVEDMLQGRMGNVDITSVSGDPGAGINIRIRGTSSLNARNNPLIVINGIPYDAEFDENFDFASADIEKFGNLIDVSPEDIESIDVLKDAASTAAWGSRASNGVLMIKTKRGIKSKPIFEYTAKATIGWEPKPIPMLDGAGYARLITEEHYNYTRNEYSNIEIAFDPEWGGATPNQYYNFSQNTNWVKEITKTSATIQHDFSVRGGGEKSRYNMSVGFFDEDGTTIGNRMQKLNLRSSLDYNLSSKLQFKTDIMYTRYDQDATYDVEDGEFGEKMVRSIAYRKMPNMSVFDRDTNNVSHGEYFTPSTTIQGNARDIYNPVAFAKLGVHNRLKDNARALFSIKYSILPTLILNSTVTLDIFDMKVTKFLPFKAVGSYEDISNRGVNEFSKKSSIYTMNQLIFHPDFGKDHDFSVMTQFDTEETVNRWYKVTTSQSGSPFLQLPVGDKHLIGGDGNFASSYSKYRSLGLFATSSYIYKDKYIFMLGAKLEGNSKFSSESRWGMFPTVSFAWRISNEPFMKLVPFISDLKLRGSWGQSGNSPKDNYLYFNTYKAGADISYLDMPGVKPGGIELTNLKWETIDQVDLGFSFFGFDDRMNIEFDWYRKKTLDLYLEKSGIPFSSGFENIQQNNGEMENKGVEFSIDYTAIQRKDFQLNFNFNLSRNQNVVISLPENYSLKYGDMLANGQYKISIQPGEPLGGFYGYRFLGVYPTDEDAVARDEAGDPVYSINSNTPLRMVGPNNYQFEGGDAKYADLNHDGRINQLDIEYLGDLNPDFMGGAGARIKYKNFVLNTFFYFKVGQKIINQTRMDTEKMYKYDNQSTATNWRWRRQGDSTDVPRALFEQGYNWLGSDRFVEDGSYLRLKTVSLSYIVDRKFCKMLKVKEMKIYATAYNLFTWTNYTGQDPDVAPPSKPDTLPKDNSRTPPSQRIMFGLNLTF